MVSKLVQAPQEQVRDGQTDDRTDDDKRNGEAQVLPIEDRINVGQSVDISSTGRPVDGSERRIGQ